MNCGVDHRGGWDLVSPDKIPLGVLCNFQNLIMASPVLFIGLLGGGHYYALKKKKNPFGVSIMAQRKRIHLVTVRLQV